MSSAEDDFEALFDQVAAERAESLAGGSPVAEAATVEVAAVGTAAVGTDAAAMESMPADTPITDAVAHSVDLMSEGSTKQSLSEIDFSSKPMYERLGNIVRMLHDSLRELGYDRSLSNVAMQINDAQGRLEYIATLTEQAATKVLNTIDIGLPQQEELAKSAKQMEDRWAALFDGKLSIEEFKALAGDSKEFAKRVGEATETEKARLLDIMMAQDFQDITGQLIKKIVGITHTVETELAQILKDNAPPEAKAAMAAAEAAKPAELMQGPSMPNAAMGQDDVDSLLADLGF